MVSNSRGGQMSDKEIEELREEMEAQREEIKAYLASEGVDVSGWDDDPDSDTTS